MNGGGLVSSFDNFLICATVNDQLTRYLPVIFFHCVLRDAGREEELDTMSLGQTMIRKMSLLLDKVWCLSLQR